MDMSINGIKYFTGHIVGIVSGVHGFPGRIVRIAGFDQFIGRIGRITDVIWAECIVHHIGLVIVTLIGIS